MRLLHSAAPALAVARSSVLLTMTDAAEGSPYRQEHLIWQPGFGQRFGATLCFFFACVAGASLSTEAWVQGMALQARVSTWMQHAAFRLEW